MNPCNLDPDAVRRLVKMPGSTGCQIAVLFGVSIDDLYQFMKAHKILIKRKMTLHFKNPAFTLENVRMLALEMNASYVSIARTVGVSNQTIQRFMLKNGISMEHPRYRMVRPDSSDRISVLSLLNP